MDLFTELFGMFDDFGTAFNMTSVPRETKACPVCGYTAEDINRHGKFGCSECYNTFRSGAERSVKQVQAHNEHCGKIPSKSGAQVRIQRRLKDLKTQLREAVAKEEYEMAAKIHSEIKELEGGAV